AVDHHLLEAALVVEHVVGNADPLRHRAGVIDVLAGAAGALAMGRGAMVVELQRDADDVVALGLEQRRRDRGIDATRHGDDHAGVPRKAFDVEAVEHCGRFRLEPLRGPAPMSSAQASRHLYYRHSMPRSHGRAGAPRRIERRPFVPGGRPRASDDVGMPSKPLDQKTFWQNAALAFGASIAVRPAAMGPPSRISWCNRRQLGCGATIGARLDPLQRPPAPLGAKGAGKELATFGTPPGRSAAAMRPASTRT